ncbi:hypothetical protein TWF730_004641 [Orbilia blumenaviensis]|uniref:Uncharacterized protein n=1 Tax=Orbilia blumenaviensis TaxID=1796055 RepID=A0AAV9TYQ8_9PEZI
MFGRRIVTSAQSANTSLQRFTISVHMPRGSLYSPLSYSRLAQLSPAAVRPAYRMLPRSNLSILPACHRAYTASRSQEESDLRHKTLKGDPAKVTTTSSIRPIVERSQAPDHGTQQDILKGGFQHDLNVIKETFAFREVPKEVLFFGGAGLVPYIATTASTFLLAWDIRNISEEGMGRFLNEETASAFLNLLEPIQVGFGAVILSFLGAIHWGLEFAAYGGNHPYQRYFLGILAPALAWPTVFMQYDIALLTQFLGFTGMYFADSRATALGLGVYKQIPVSRIAKVQGEVGYKLTRVKQIPAPKWYTTYRFLLTFVVGACIVMTLIGRGKIEDKTSSQEASQERVHKLRQGEGLETTSAEYRQLVRQDQQEIQRKAWIEKEKTEERLAQKEAEYIKAKEAAERAARKTAG